MTILHVIASMDPKMGGVCKAVRMIINGLGKFNIDNEVVSFDPQEASYLEVDSFVIHALGCGKTPWGYNKKLIPWLIDNFNRFDIIILHGLWLYNGYAIKKALHHIDVKFQQSNGNKKVAPKFFVMPHGMLDPYFQKAANRKLKAIRNWAYWKLIESNVVNKSNGLLFTSEEEQRLAKESFKPYAPRQEIIVGLGLEDPLPYNSTMREAFLDKCPELKNHSYLLFLSRIHEKKGVDILINAYTELYSNMGAKSLDKKEIPKLVIAGPNLTSLYGYKMQKLVSQSSAVKHMIHFTDMLTGDSKWGAFYGCDAFILPSHQENFGIAVVEALACSKPVIISNKINLWREINVEGGGLIGDDTKDGLIKMLTIWNHLSYKEKIDMSLRARASFDKYFSIDSAASRMLAII